ncbi:hypothetical protein LZ31DRAFT_80344 [Colletotrichum somersetense]|nr:hypothetical protein LZ31DRAFT_80344 [Colletotrichum somersetense]
MVKVGVPRPVSLQRHIRPPPLPPFFPPPSVYGYLSAYCGHRYCDSARRTQSACRFHRDGDPGQGSRHKGRSINRHQGMGRHQPVTWRSGDEQANRRQTAAAGMPSQAAKVTNHGPEWWQNSLIHFRSGQLDIRDWEINLRLIARKNSNLWFCIFILISNDWGADMGFLSRCHFPCTHQNHVRRPDSTHDLPCSLSFRSVHPLRLDRLIVQKSAFYRNHRKLFCFFD